MYYDLAYSQEYTENGVSLLTSILLRYSEIGSVQYCHERHALKFTFMIRQSEDADKIKATIIPALEVFHQLEGQRMRVIEIYGRIEENVTILSVIRDVDSMTQRELGLIIELLRSQYPSTLICDDISIPEEDEVLQEELISQMLSSIRLKDIEKNVVALREDGRVLIFKN